MKLSTYARQIGITYKTAYRMFKRGELDAYQLPTGTIVVNEPESPLIGQGVALYARVSSHDQKADAQRQLERLRDYAAAKGYKVTGEVIEVASGLNDQRPQFSRLLTDNKTRVILVEHKDRATRFGFNYIALLLEAQGRQIEVINESDTKDELVDDFVALITSMAARIYVRRSSKRRAVRIRDCVEQVYEVGEDEDSTCLQNRTEGQ
jgi:predicted site-specific integrase-resolvase